MVTTYLEHVTFKEFGVNDTYKRLLYSVVSPSSASSGTAHVQDVQTIEHVNTTTSGSAASFYWLPVEQTYPYHYDREMAQLERAVLLEDTDGFAQLVADMDWQIRSADDFLKAIELALRVGAHLTARKLTLDGASRFPQDVEIMKHAKILAPVKTIQSNAPADPGVAKNNQWLKEHRDEYQGMWVALRDGNMLAFGRTMQDVKNQVGSLKNSRILVTKVY